MAFKSDDTVDNYGTDSPLLASHVFSNKLTYLLINYKGLSFALAFEIFLLVILIGYNIGDNDAIILCLILGTLLVAFTGLIVYFSTRDIGLVRENELTFLKEITTVKPGLDHGKWNSIASKLNPIFYKNCPSATPYFFYDGEACASCFRRRYLNPYIFSKCWHTKRQQNEARSQSFDLNAAQADLGQGQREWVSYNEFDPFIEKAVNAYQESLEACWNQLMNGSSSVSQIGK